MTTISQAITALGIEDWVLRGEPTNEEEFNAMFRKVTGADSNGSAIESDKPSDFGTTWKAVSDKKTELINAEPLRLLREERDRSLKDVDDETYEQIEGFLCDYVNILEEKTQELLIEAAPVNSIGDASHLAGLGKNPPATFAGMRVFRIKNDTYNKLLRGKKKYARWQNYISAEEASEIRDYIRRNPKKSVVLMDDSYGTMTILRRHNEI